MFLNLPSGIGTCGSTQRTVSEQGESGWQLSSSVDVGCPRAVQRRPDRATALNANYGRSGC
jgi:hypothetical protein